MMDAIMSADFFISYTSPDLAWAEWVGWVLEESGAIVVMQAWDFVPGMHFVLEMQRATASSRQTIAILSPDYLKSRFTPPEWAAAFALDPEGKKRTLIPVRVRECALEGMLSTIVHIDLVGLDETSARKRLVDGISGKRIKRDHAPFPGTTLKPFPGEQVGSFPSAWNVPYPRNPNFIGRSEIIARLQKDLQAGPAAVTQAIAGLGGIGKTQLALRAGCGNLHRTISGVSA
jgi:hypothetical protein